MLKADRNLVDIECRRSFTATLFMTITLILIGLVTLFVGLYKVQTILYLSVIEIVAGIIFFAVRITTSNKRRKLFTEELQSFTFCAENTAKVAVNNFPSPMVVVSVKGEIQWYNENFEALVNKGKLFGEYIQDIFPDIQFSRFVEDDNPDPVELDYKGGNFLVSGKTVRTERNGVMGTMVGIYFTDLTEENRLKNKIEDDKIVIVSLMIDDYDEVLKYTPKTEHSGLLGNIEGIINDWVEKGKGIKFRYERDRYLLLFESKNFKPLMSDKFSILNEVKSIDRGNKLPVTLSIGVGKDGKTLSDNERNAAVALDMALGRGGDQVVVKTAEALQFYGARSREIEKSTRVKARVVAQALKELVTNSSNIIIMGHKNSDADSLGAAVGLFRTFKNEGKEVYIAINKQLCNTRNILECLVKIEDYNECLINDEKALSLINDRTLLIIVDTHRSNLVEYKNVLEAAKNIVLIDHHRRSEDYIDNTVLSYHEPYASSTCEMVAEVLQYICEKPKLDPVEVEAIYSGLYLDTRGFNFKTGVRTFEAASYLRRLGANPANVKRMFRNDLDVYIEKAHIISNAKIYRDNIAISLSDYSGENAQLVVAQAADDLLNIKGIEAAFVLANVGNKVIISGRSFETVNVQLVLEKLGGGGHLTIAGAQLKDTSMAFAEMRLRMAIDDVLYDAQNAD